MKERPFGLSFILFAMPMQSLLKTEIEVAGMARKSLGRGIDKGHGKVDCSRCFGGAGGDEFELCCVSTDIACGIHSRQTRFHFFVYRYGIDFHFEAPALQKVEVDDETNIHQDRITIDGFFFASTVIKNDGLLDLVAFGFDFLELIKGLDVYLVALHLFDGGLHGTELISGESR